MLGTLEQNGVAKKRNLTLMDTLESMASQTNLSQWVCYEALKTAIYSLNRDSSKYFSKTYFDYGQEGKLSLFISFFGLLGRSNLIIQLKKNTQGQ